MWSRATLETVMLRLTMKNQSCYLSRVVRHEEFVICDPEVGHEHCCIVSYIYIEFRFSDFVFLTCVCGHSVLASSLPSSSHMLDAWGLCICFMFVFSKL